MKRLPILLLCLVPVVTASHTATGVEDDAVSVGVGQGTTLSAEDDPPCDGELLLTWDGDAENGYAWRYHGIAPPYYGAFAEGYDATGHVCGVALFFTENHTYYERPMDVYVWDSEGSAPPDPGAVLSVVIDLYIDPPAQWPEVSQHDVPTPDTPVSGRFFVGYWGNWPGLSVSWFVAADLDDPRPDSRAPTSPPGSAIPPAGRMSRRFGARPKPWGSART